MIRLAVVATLAGLSGTLVLYLGALAVAALIRAGGSASAQQLAAFAAVWGLLAAFCFLGLYALRVLASAR